MPIKSIHFEEHEIALIQNAELILAKKNAIEKISELFHSFAFELELDKKIKSRLNKFDYKISKGEAYKNLPYLVLDFPKIQTKKFDILCRTMFWWGNYFSFNFFVKTDLIDFKKISKSNSDAFILMDNDIWNQVVNSDSFKQIDSLNEKDFANLSTNEYLKISKKHPLKEYKSLNKVGLQFYQNVFELLI